MKKIIIGLVVLVVVVIGGAAIAISLVDVNQYKGMIAEEAKKATGRDLTLDGDLKLNISFTPSVSVNGVTFANADWGSRKEMVKLERFEAELQLIPLIFGDIQVNRLVLVGLDVVAETNAQGVGNWVFDTGAPAQPAAAPKAEGESGAFKLPVVRQVHLENIKITYKDGQKGETIDLALDSLEASADSATSPLKIKVAGSYNGVAYNAAGQVGSIQTMLDGGKFPIELEAAALGATVSLKGEVADPRAAKGIDMVVGANVPDLEGTINQAAAIVPALKDTEVPNVAISFSGHVTDPAGGYAVDNMNLNIGQSDLSGKLRIALGGARPNVVAELSSNLIDVDALLPPKQEGATPRAAAGQAGGAAKPDDGRVFPNDPLPLDGLKAADADVKFRGKLVKAAGNEVKDIAVDVMLKDGRLNVKPLSASLGTGGTVAGELALDGSGQAAVLATKLNVTQFDYGAFLKATQNQDIVEGKIDVAADIRGTGASVRALMAGLDGKLTVTGKGGRINSNALNIVSTDLIDLAKLSNSEGDKDIRCIMVDFDIAKGQAKSKYILVETGGMAVVGKGGIDLAQEQPDLFIDPRSKKANLIKVAIPFTVKGTLKSPSVRPDTAALAGSVAGTAAKVGAAVATGGVSLLAGAASDAAGITGGADTTDYCALAFAGKPLEPEKSSSSESGEKSSGPAGAVGDAVKGVGGTLKGILGGGK
jgi:hypothetical protein